MKVLYITNIPSPYRVDFFSKLGEECDLTVLYERAKASDRNENWKSEEKYAFKAIYLNGLNITSDSAFSFSILKWIKKGLFDVVVIGGYSTYTAMLAIMKLKFLGIPFFLNADGGLIKETSYIKRAIKTFFISSASHWLSTGQLTDDYLIEYGANKNNIFTYPFSSVSVDDLTQNILTKEDKAKLKIKLGLENKKTVLSIGQFIYRKGFDVLLKAWSKVNDDYNLIIIGGGEKTSEYQDQIKNMELENVIILDFMSKEELKTYYLMCDVFVLPTREDIWGLVINEAMAAGLPVITTNKCVGGIELLDKDYIVPVENEIELANKINSILSNDLLRGSIGEKNLKRISHYTIENMVETHLNIFRRYLNGF